MPMSIITAQPHSDASVALNRVNVMADKVMVISFINNTTIVQQYTPLVKLWTTHQMWAFFCPCG